MVKISSKQAQSRFGEMIDKAQHEPVTIERHGRPIAVVLSTEDYERFQAMEDALWSAKVEKSLESGFLSAEETREFIEETLKRADS